MNEREMPPVNATLWHYDVFTKQINQGNPAGVVPDADLISEAAMQRMAQAIGFNETVFICQSQVADIRFRYFTPGHEIDLCGHGTIAAVYHLHSTNRLSGKSAIHIEASAGIIEVKINEHAGNCFVEMTQAKPKFTAYQGDVDRLAASIGIQAEDIDGDYPIMYGSTGTWTLLVPIRKLATFSRMKPQNHLFPQVLEQMPRSSIHPFCLSAFAPHCDIHSRHFSSPYSGTIEDPVTGTASGAIGAYYATYIDRARTEYHFQMEQGQEIDRNGEVSVQVLRSTHELDVSIAGTAVFVKKQEWNLR